MIDGYGTFLDARAVKGCLDASVIFDSANARSDRCYFLTECAVSTYADEVSCGFCNACGSALVIYCIQWVFQFACAVVSAGVHVAVVCLVGVDGRNITMAAGTGDTTGSAGLRGSVTARVKVLAVVTVQYGLIRMRDIPDGRAMAEDI